VKDFKNAMDLTSEAINGRQMTVKSVQVALILLKQRLPSNE